MDPAVKVLEANFHFCRAYIREKVARVTVSLFKDDQFTGDGRSMDRNDGVLEYDVCGNTDKIKIEIFPGMFLESAGLPLETILQRVEFYQLYDCVDVYQYTKDGGVELYSYSFDEEEIEVDVYDDVTRLVVSLGNGYDKVVVEKVEGETQAEGYDTVH